jgi:hypothetical protein
MGNSGYRRSVAESLRKPSEQSDSRLFRLVELSMVRRCGMADIFKERSVVANGEELPISRAIDPRSPFASSEKVNNVFVAIKWMGEIEAISRQMGRLHCRATFCLVAVMWNETPSDSNTNVWTNSLNVQCHTID